MEKHTPLVVFVCEHGSAKSLVAAILSRLEGVLRRLGSGS